MKLFLQPSRISAHRIACIALYRALLEQCPRVQHLAEGWPATPLTFKHLIRKQFRRNQHVQSSRLVAAALQAGYEAEEMLRHAGDGEETAKSKVMTILHQVEETRILSRENAAIIPFEKREKRRLPSPYPGAKPVLESRPRPQEELGGSGLRKVPVFVNANVNPILRFSKHHSPFLARVLQDKVTRVDRINRRIIAAEKLVNMGRSEDEWDKLVKGLQQEEIGKETWKKNKPKETGKLGANRWKEPEDFEQSWSDAIHQEIRKDREILNQDHRKKEEMARKMLDIVSQEESLLARERMERKKIRKRERMEEQSNAENS